MPTRSLSGFTATKASVYDLVIKGGSKSSWYNYDATGGPGHSGDSNLHRAAEGQYVLPGESSRSATATRGRSAERSTTT